MKIDNNIENYVDLNNSIKNLRDEIIFLNKQKDLAKQEIADQRKGRNIVSSELYEMKDKLYNLEITLKNTELELNKQREAFHSLVDKHWQTIEKLNKHINELTKRLENQKSKKLIDIDWENIKYKKEISLKQKEYQLYVDKIEELKQQEEEFKKYVIEKNNEILSQKEKNDIIFSENIKKQKDLNILEKRLLKLKAKLEWGQK